MTDTDAGAITAPLPFAGFYYSHTDSQLDHYVELLAEDAEDAERLENAIDWKGTHLAVARAYCEWIAAEAELDGVEFHAMVSPKFYNFETDRILAAVPPTLVAELHARYRDATGFVEYVRTMLTARSGFVPFYPAELSEWPDDVGRWESPQVGLMLDWHCFATLVEASENPVNALEVLFLESVAVNELIEYRD